MDLKEVREGMRGHSGGGGEGWGGLSRSGGEGGEGEEVDMVLSVVEDEVDRWMSTCHLAVLSLQKELRCLHWRVRSSTLLDQSLKRA